MGLCITSAQHNSSCIYRGKALVWVQQQQAQQHNPHLEIE